MSGGTEGLLESIGAGFKKTGPNRKEVLSHFHLGALGQMAAHKKTAGVPRRLLNGLLHSFD